MQDKERLAYFIFTMKFNFNTAYKQSTKKLLKEAFDFNSIEDEEEDYASKSIKDTMTELSMGQWYLDFLNNLTPFDASYSFINMDNQYTFDLGIMKVNNDKESKYNSFYNTVLFRSTNDEIRLYSENKAPHVGNIQDFMFIYSSTVQYLANIQPSADINLYDCYNNYPETPLPFAFNNVNEMSYWFNKCTKIRIAKHGLSQVTKEGNSLPEFNGNAYVIFGCNSYDEYKKGINLIKSALIFSSCKMVTIFPVLTESSNYLAMNKSAVPYICKDILGNKKPEEHFASRHIRQFSENYILKKLQNMRKNPVMSPVNMYSYASTPSTKLLYAAWVVYNAATIVMPASTKLEEMYNEEFTNLITLLPIPKKQMETQVTTCLVLLFTAVKATSEDFAAMYLYLSDILDRSEI